MATIKNNLEVLKKVNWYSSKNEAFQNGTGDNFFLVEGFWTCISENDPIFVELKNSGYKTELEIYLSKLK